MKYNKKLIKTVSLTLLTVMISQLVMPTAALALTTGPSQPEVQSFEPVGTTDMVNMFTGSFVYNIPLMDVEGYPVNISYHGGVTMEQEASWVGLGWNINPGEINRTVRGVPDDFNGDTVKREFHMRDETTIRAGIGGGGEIAGFGDPFIGLDIDAGANINISNYSGVSCDFSLGGGINIEHTASVGVNLGIGSQSGASIDYNANINYRSSLIYAKDAADVGIEGGYSTRTAVKDVDLSFKVPALGMNISHTLPVSLQNYVPVVTNRTIMNTTYGRLKIGAELWSGYPYGNINAMVSRLHYNNDGSRPAYGYLYLQNAGTDTHSILDFTRDRDGMFNKTMQYLPVPAMAYDVYSVTGQGTGGVFRPFRNDFGSVYDPTVLSESTSHGDEIEVGIGNLFEDGVDVTNSNTEITSGPWSDYLRAGTTKGFRSNSPGSIFENVYFKQAGELTAVDSDYFNAIGNARLITPHDAMALPAIKPHSTERRDARGNLMYYYTAEEAAMPGVGTNPNIVSYSNMTFTDYPAPATQTISRIGSGDYQHKKDQVSEIREVEKDGKRYIYGIPAMNNVQRDATFSVDLNGGNHLNTASGAVSISDTDRSPKNVKGRAEYYNSSITPSYAHSYLLTSVLSPDYVDVTGNGPTDDDLGSYTKFNYTRTDSDYRWAAPYSASLDSAQYDPGFWSDEKDDKGTLICGSREQWMLHSIETKNYIAEFYISQRNDARGIQSAVIDSGSSVYKSNKTLASVSYKLDSIKLYNKHDRIYNKDAAVPIKTVFFQYDYSLCPGVPNAVGGGGKLTLAKIYFRYGNSNKSMISPYQFTYSSFNPHYNLADKDRWGDYKPSNTTFPNYEYPYVDQGDENLNDQYASAWSLTNITLPSGGNIGVDYQMNDYAYVQNRAADAMFMADGVGSSPSFSSGTMLFQNKDNPYLYIYFKRSSHENPNLSFEDNYFGIIHRRTGGPKVMYFNFDVRLTGANNTYEHVKGYANVSDYGPCSDGVHGYVRLTPVTPTGGGSSLNPITYTTLNVGRFYLPQILFPGQDPNASDLQNILKGLKQSGEELFKMGKNPYNHLVDQGHAQIIDLNKSYIRLQCAGLMKKGGGQRVSKLTFYDNWQELAGGNEQQATYGKTYDYTINDPVYGTISSGVASYEPLVGGDENSLRQPVPYTAQLGSNWPPNDPIDLYQELPIGESLYPPGLVGYSQVRVTSIHKDIAKSSQEADLYQFYTAKDFPIEARATGINLNSHTSFGFFNQENLLQATQGYTLLFNDMHGKLKRVEHDKYNPSSGTYQPVTYQVYNYHQSGDQLNNTVNCVVNDLGNMVVKPMSLGMEEDVTLDSRQKNEDTRNSNKNYSLNVFIVFLFPVPIPVTFGWSGEYKNDFQSATVSKVVQQYGILDNVVSYNEDAVTTMKNELFDPNTGDAIATSVNNEYKDKEYTMNIPAYWAYKGMAPAYSNIGYTDTGYIAVGPHGMGRLKASNVNPLDAGDEVSVFYKDKNGQRDSTVAWIGGVLPYYWQDTSYTVNSHIVHDTVPAIPQPITITQYYWNGGPVNIYGSTDQHSICNCPPPNTSGQLTYRAIIQGTFNVPANSNVTGGYYVSGNLIGSDTLKELQDCNNTITNVVSPSWYNLNMTVTNVHITTNGQTQAYVNGSLDANNTPPNYTIAFNGSFTLLSRLDTTGWTPNTKDSTYTAYDTIPNYTPHSICGGMSIVPRFPQNTTGWVAGDTLTNVTIKVIHSGRNNMLNQYAETYTGMNYPVDASGKIPNTLSNLVSLTARTYADSGTRMLYNYLMNGDTINPYAIGERGVWRLQNEYAYITPRDYSNPTSRNNGLFSATSFYAPLATNSSLCSNYPFFYMQPANSDPNWHLERAITKWSPAGKEVENIDAVGNYSTAVYGYDETLPVAVASNARQGEVFADGFEDYRLLRPADDLMKFVYSPFIGYFTPSQYTSIYDTLKLNASNALNVVTTTAHTGMYSLYVPGTAGQTYLISIPIDRPEHLDGAYSPYNMYYPFDPYVDSINYKFSSANEYLPFKLNPGKTYILSLWLKQQNPAINATGYSFPGAGIIINGNTFPLKAKTGIIDGWQQMEVGFPVVASDYTLFLSLPTQYYVDDIRMYPADANVKSFVYDPFNQRLMATLDENNFATIYEYDQEGNLVRVKKETPKGIMTVSESRSGNPKVQ